jgi:hypothetical protein
LTVAEFLNRIPRLEQRAISRGLIGRVRIRWIVENRMQLAKVFRGRVGRRGLVGEILVLLLSVTDVVRLDIVSMSVPVMRRSVSNVEKVVIWLQIAG